MKSKESIFLIFSMNSVLRFGLSLKVAFRIIAWSLKWLELGLWPTEDWNGEPIFYAKAAIPFSVPLSAPALPYQI